VWTYCILSNCKHRIYCNCISTLSKGQTYKFFLLQALNKAKNCHQNLMPLNFVCNIMLQSKYIYNMVFGCWNLELSSLTKFVGHLFYFWVCAEGATLSCMKWLLHALIYHDLWHSLMCNYIAISLKSDHSFLSVTLRYYLAKGSGATVRIWF
jgi:hypothetical protein